MSLKMMNIFVIISYLLLAFIIFLKINNLDLFPSLSIIVLEGRISFSDPVISLAIPIIALLLMNIIPSSIKDKIVYLKWNNPLPGTRIFTSIALKDPRIDLLELASKYGELPTDPNKQNKLWYKIYKTKEKDKVINNSHRFWLLFRDMLSISILLYIPLVVISYILNGLYIGTIYLLSCIILLLFIWISARNAGNRFACNVLAR